MDYTRIYWLCILGIGILFFLSSIPDLLAGGLGIAVVGIIGSAIMITGALYGLARSESVTGPTEPNIIFWTIVLAFVLVLAGTVLSFV